MSVFLSNYAMLTPVFNLSNSSDVIANSFSVIDDSEIVNILDLIGTGGGGVGTTTGDVYTKTQTDDKLALKQNTIYWLTGDSTNKNTISTGEGLFTIAVPSGSYLTRHDSQRSLLHRQGGTDQHVN